MDLNKKLIDQLSDLSRNIKSLTSEVKENKNVVSAENANTQKESAKDDSGKKESSEDQNKKFLKSLEGIFKKGIGEITKSNVESKGILKDVVGSVKGKGLESALGAISPLKDKALESITSNENIPKGISALLGKIPKFASGGVMDKTGVALVGEKGPEVVKLDKGTKVIPAGKTEEIMSSMKTMDQTILEKKGPTNDQIEKYKNQLEKDDFYKSYPDRLIEDINTWKNRNKDRSPLEIDGLMKDYWGNKESTNKELPTKLSPIVNKIPEIQQETKELTKKEKREKEKEDKIKAKIENKKVENLLKPESKIQGEEEKPKVEKKGPTLMEKAKGLLKEKGALDKGKNLLFSKGKDLLTGKMSIKDIAKNPSSLFGDKSQLMGKGVGAATSLLSNKGLREKGMAKLKGLKKEKSEEKSEEKSSMATESPELKKVKTETPKEEEKKQEEKKEPKKEIPKTESKAATPEKEAAKTESPKTGSVSSGKTSADMGSADMADIKSLLGRMVSLLEGPLSIETMDSPFRPDSRRF
jgi:hypothetical protein